MRKVIIPILIALVLVIGNVMPVSAAIENWPLFSESTGGNAYYSIDTHNFQVESFTLTAGERAIGLSIYERGDWTTGDLIFHIECQPYETTTLAINNFKFRQIPGNDPDDPNSIRYPINTYIYVGTGEYWGQ